MNKQDYMRWRSDAYNSLVARYDCSQVKTILDWFDSIKASGERDLIGEEALEAFLKFHPYSANWSLYDSLMSRLWVYAPLILKEQNV